MKVQPFIELEYDIVKTLIPDCFEIINIKKGIPPIFIKLTHTNFKDWIICFNDYGCDESGTNSAESNIRFSYCILFVPKDESDSSIQDKKEELNTLLKDVFWYILTEFK